MLFNRPTIVHDLLKFDAGLEPFHKLQLSRNGGRAAPDVLTDHAAAFPSLVVVVAPSVPSSLPPHIVVLRFEKTPFGVRHVLGRRFLIHYPIPIGVALLTDTRSRHYLLFHQVAQH